MISGFRFGPALAYSAPEVLMTKSMKNKWKKFVRPFGIFAIGMALGFSTAHFGFSGSPKAPRLTMPRFEQKIERSHWAAKSARPKHIERAKKSKSVAKANKSKRTKKSANSKRNGKKKRASVARL